MNFNNDNSSQITASIQSTADNYIGIVYSNVLNSYQTSLVPSTILYGIGSNLTLINYLTLSNLPSYSITGANNGSLSFTNGTLTLSMPTNYSTNMTLSNLITPTSFIYKGIELSSNLNYLSNLNSSGSLTNYLSNIGGTLTGPLTGTIINATSSLQEGGIDLSNKYLNINCNSSNALTASNLIGNPNINVSNIVSLGIVGIGITNPSTSDLLTLRTSISSSNADINFINNVSSNTIIGVGGSSSSTLNSSYSNNFFIHARCNIILNANSNSVSTNPHLFISTSGNIGIGTNILEQKFTVEGTTPSIIRVQTNTNNINQVSGIEFGIPAFSSAKCAKITSTTDSGDANNLRFYTNATSGISATERLTILSNGNIGIGTNNPTSRLHIFETTGTDATTSTGSLIIQHANSGGVSSITFPSTVASANGDYAYIKYIENVSSTSSFTQFNYFNATSNQTGALIIGCENDASIAGPDSVIINPAGNIALVPRNNITYITGRIGIGITNPSTTDLLTLKTSSTTSDTDINFINNLNSNAIIGVGGSSSLSLNSSYSNNFFIHARCNIILNANSNSISNDPHLFISTSGNIGIGTSTNLNNTLTIDGSLSVSNIISLGSISGIGSNLTLVNYNNLSNLPNLGIYALSSSLSSYQSNLNASTTLLGIGSNLTLINYNNLSNLPNLGVYALSSSLGAYQSNLTASTNINVANITSTGTISGTTINASGNLQEAGININTKYLLNAGGTLTGVLNLTGLSSGNNPLYISSTNTTANNCIHIKNNSTFQAFIGIGGTAFSGNYANNLFIESASSSIVFNTGGNTSTSVPRMFINSSGNVGINTTNPGNILQVGDGARFRVSNGTTDYSLLGSKNTDDTNNTRIVISGHQRPSFSGNIDLVTTTNGSHIFNNGSTELMRLLSTGNLAIGITNPSVNDLLTLRTSLSSSNTNINFINNINSNAIIGVGGSTSTSLNSSYSNNFFIHARCNIILNANNNTISNLPHLFISTTGNIGIGTSTNLNSNLTINGSLSASNITINNSGTNKIIFNDAFQDIKIQLNSGYGLGIQANTLLYSSLNTHRFMTGATQTMILDNLGNLTTTKNIDCGGGIAINGSNAFYNISDVDAGNLTNTYINFKMAGATNDWCYLRQIGAPETFKLTFDFLDDLDARFCIRSITSTNNPDTIKEVFTVDNGNVGIGTNNPISKLHIHTNLNSEVVGIKITDLTTGAGNADGFGIFKNASHETWIQNYEVANLYLDTAGNNTIFNVAGSERMRITNTGNVAIGITNPSVNDLLTLRTSLSSSDTDINFINNLNSNAIIGVGGSTSTSLNSSYQNNLFIHALCNIVLNANNNTSATNPHLFISTNGKIGIGISNPSSSYALTVSSNLYVLGTIYSTGDIAAFFSDDRLKTKISTINNPLNIINNLSGFKFLPNEIANSYGIYNDKIDIGLSAQEVQKVLPEIVSIAPFDREEINGKTISKSGKDYLTIKYDKLIPVLVESIKELNKKINNITENFENRIKNIENKLL